MIHNTPNDIVGFEVLCFEDEEKIREAFPEMQKRRMKNIMAVVDGSIGLNMFRSHHFDMIITDIMMPAMAYSDLTAGIKKSDSFIPVLITTANEFKDFLHKVIKAGINNYLIKPFQKESLIPTFKEMSSMVIFKKKIAGHPEFIKLPSGTEKKCYIWASIKNFYKINSDFFCFYGFSSRENFYSLHEIPFEFFLKNGSKIFRYNSTKYILWIDSFMKLNGVKPNTIPDMSGTSTLEGFSLSINRSFKTPKLHSIFNR
jgi:CheY-like chemotaxis protein